MSDPTHEGQVGPPRGLTGTREPRSETAACITDIATLHDNDRIGACTRSLTIAINLGATPITWSIDENQTVDLVSGEAIVLRSLDNTQIASSYRCAECSKVLVIKTSPINAMDPELGAHLERILIDLTAKPRLLGCRARALAHELYSTENAGVARRLLAERCALVLLACAVGDQQRDSAATPWSIHPRDIEKIHRVRDKLLATLGAEHHLCDLAREIGMSTSTLKCKFAAVVGQPVFQFLRDQRLDRARDGILYEGWTVSQAAFLVGYRHATNFATAFRRRFGVAPTSAIRAL